MSNSPQRIADSSGGTTVTTENASGRVNTTGNSSLGQTLPSLGTSSQWQNISNYTEFMDSLISFLNVSYTYMSHVRAGSGRSPGCGNPVGMTEEEKEQRISEIVCKLEEKFEELRRLEEQRQNMSGTSAPKDSRLATMGTSQISTGYQDWASSTISDPAQFNPTASSTRNQTGSSAAHSSRNVTGSSGLQSTVGDGTEGMTEEQRQQRIAQIQRLLQEKYAEIERLEAQQRNLSGQSSVAHSSGMTSTGSSRLQSSGATRHVTCPSGFVPSGESFSPNAASTRIQKDARAAAAGYSYQGDPYSSSSRGYTQPSSRNYQSEAGAAAEITFNRTQPSASNRTYTAPAATAADRTYAVSPAAAAVRKFGSPAAHGNRTYQAGGVPGDALYKASGSPKRFSPPAASSRVGDSSGCPSSYYSQDTGRWPGQHTWSNASGGYWPTVTDSTGSSRPSSQPRKLAESSLGEGCFLDCSGTQQHRIGGTGLGRVGLGGAGSLPQTRRTF